MTVKDWRAIASSALVVIAAEAAVIVALFGYLFYERLRPPPPPPAPPPAPTYSGPSACYYDREEIPCRSITIIPRSWMGR
jgi:hypothetical protein